MARLPTLLMLSSSFHCVTLRTGLGEDLLSSSGVTHDQQVNSVTLSEKAEVGG